MPCSRVVDFAKSTLEDAKGSGSKVTACKAVTKLAELRHRDAEEGVHSILHNTGFTIPIPITPIQEDNLIVGGLPRLRPLDFMAYMVETGNLHRLLGGESLQSAKVVLKKFWDFYQHTHPDFELYRLGVPLETCIPIFAHADGGRGYKKSEFMVFNWSAVLGTGCGKTNQKDPALKRRFRKKPNAMQINLLGHSYCTHYLWAVMSAQLHKQEDKFQEMMLQFRADLRECFDTGIQVQQDTWRLVCLGLKGDLKLQARAGRLTRWASTARKGPINPNSSSQTLGRCCWLCPAGDVNFPFEQLNTESPAWLVAMPNFREPPWNVLEESGLMMQSLRYLVQPAKFFVADLFHVYLAGFGQDFAAAALVYMLPIVFVSNQGASVEHHLETLNQKFKAYRKLYRVQTNLASFSRNFLSYTDNTKVFPTGTWSKAADTSKIIDFIRFETDMALEDLPFDNMIYHINLASKALGVCMRRLYDSDLWIEARLQRFRYSICFSFWLGKICGGIDRIA